MWRKSHICGAKIIPQILWFVWAACVTVCNNAARREGSPQCKHFTRKIGLASTRETTNAKAGFIGYYLFCGLTDTNEKDLKNLSSYGG